MSNRAEAFQNAVDKTNSQDLAAGLMAERDKSRQGFLENGQADPVKRRPRGGNRALQDYQMQLTLLEQQKKKRELMGEEEQKQGRETHSLKRLRVDTQAEQSYNNSSSPPTARKNRRKGAAGSIANTEPVDQNPQQGHISSATAVVQDTTSQDVSLLDTNRMQGEGGKDREPEVVMILPTR